MRYIGNAYNDTALSSLSRRPDLSLKAVFQMGEAKAYETFRAMRWPETDGVAVCPRCGCYETYDISTRKRFKCVACHHQFSVTSGTIFASRKMSYTDLLAAIVIFVNGAKGIAALQLSRDLDCQYKTAFVLAHKLREAMAAEMAGRQLNGIVEIDGAYFGGYVKPENRKEDRIAAEQGNIHNPDVTAEQRQSEPSGDVAKMREALHVDAEWFGLSEDTLKKIDAAWPPTLPQEQSQEAAREAIRNSS